MRIAINTRVLIPGQVHGVGVFTREVCQRLVAMRPEDEFLFLFDRPFDPSFIFGSNVEGRHLFPPARHAFLFYVWFEWQVARALHQWKADVFFSPDAYLSLRSSVPSLPVMHDVNFERFPQHFRYNHRWHYQRFWPKYAAHAPKIATVSEFSKSEIVHFYGVQPEKVSVVGNGVQPEAWPALSAEEQRAFRADHTQGRPYFFYLGHWYPRKNLVALVKAWEHYRASSPEGAMLVLAGRDSGDYAALHEAIEASPFRADIVLPGAVAQDDARKWMGSALAMVYVSMYEGFGLPMLEAMSAEVPVLAAQATALPEVAGEAACWVDPRNIHSMAEGMQRLAGDEAYRKDLIEKGKKRLGDFSWDAVAEKVSELLNEIHEKHEVSTKR